MKYINRKAISIFFISVTFCMIICICLIMSKGCDSLFSWGEEIVIGQLSDVKNGKLLLHVELKERINAWSIIFGEPENPEKMKKIGDQILNQKLIVSIANKNNTEITFRSITGLVEILPEKEKEWYSGTLSNLIFKTGGIKTSNYYGDKPCIYDVRLEFEDKSIQINAPIKIVAYWHDTL